MKSLKTRVKLFYLYGQHNAGDAAIGLGALASLKKMNCEIEAFSRWPEEFNEYKENVSYYKKNFPGVKYSSGPYVFRRSTKFFESLISYIGAIFGLIFGGRRTKLINTIKNSDLVVLNGGNLVRCQSVSDFVRLLAFFYPLIIAKKLGVPYVILPQSTLKINFLGKILLRNLFVGAKNVWIREKESLVKFNEMFPGVKFLYAPDMAFSVVDSYAVESGSESDIIKVAITLRDRTLGDIKQLSNDKRENIKRVVIDALQSISEHNKCVFTFVVQCDNDEAISKELIKQLESLKWTAGNEFQIADSRDTYALIDIFAKQDLLIGMRLHSIIMALTKGTPCVGFFERSWGLKNPGLLSLFELPAAYIGEENTGYNENILEIINARVDWRNKILKIVNEQKDNFRKEFDEVLSDIK